MQVGSLIAKIYIDYKGKNAGKAPKPGDVKYPVYISRINDALDQWAEMQYNWRSLTHEVNVPVVNNIAELPENFLRFTDAIYVDGKPYTYIDFADRMTVESGIYTYGHMPQMAKVVSKEPIAEGELNAGAIYRPSHVSTDTDIVVCDNYRWLALTVAAAIAANDPAKDDISGDLYQKAQVEFDIMVDALNKKPKGTITRIQTTGYPIMGRTW